MVSKVDTSVGPFEGASMFFRIEKGKPVFGELKGESFLQYRKRVNRREKIMENT
jgi:hypothetical protein